MQKYLASLYIVATPIGNLLDITHRAIDVLKKVDLIAAEDTRTSAKLLNHFSISTKCIAYHEHNERSSAEKLISEIEIGKNIALICDAGTPLISDPGYILVALAHKKGIRVEPIPGPSALMAALSSSGLATDQFLFVGFLPSKRIAREKALVAKQGVEATFVIYESCHRISGTVKSLIKIFGGHRKVCFAREITKQFETIKQFTLIDLFTFIDSDENQSKGEIVLIVEGAPKENDIDWQMVDTLLKSLLQKLSPSDAAKICSQYFTDQKIKIKKKDCYQRAIKLNEE